MVVCQAMTAQSFARIRGGESFLPPEFWCHLTSLRRSRGYVLPLILEGVTLC